MPDRSNDKEVRSEVRVRREGEAKRVGRREKAHSGRESNGRRSVLEVRHIWLHSNEIYELVWILYRDQERISTTIELSFESPGGEKWRSELTRRSPSNPPGAGCCPLIPIPPN